METFKKYLPLIVIVIAGFFLLRMFKSKGPTILPQTQLQETPYTDPLAALRGPAFELLAQTGIAQIQSERDVQLANIQANVAGGQQRLQENIARGQQATDFGIAIQNLQNQLRQFDILEILGLKSEETELAKTGLQTELAKYLQQSQLDFNRFKEQSYLQQLQLYFQQREQDRQAQQAAINRYYSSRNTGQIIGSIGQALGGIFGNRGTGNIFSTPPTFPTTSFTGGFDFGGLF